MKMSTTSPPRLPHSRPTPAPLPPPPDIEGNVPAGQASVELSASVPRSLPHPNHDYAQGIRARLSNGLDCFLLLGYLGGGHKQQPGSRVGALLSVADNTRKYTGIIMNKLCNSLIWDNYISDWDTHISGLENYICFFSEIA